ncbi:hypothetical protein VNI00_012074 [Paramarasmius palmivorus]|uniref:Uncharacterized protein n=1 Tax=Paramarasmius palmivorus TaxID=297713 RepID=A0AAW0C8Z7_9AGAR
MQLKIPCVPILTNHTRANVCLVVDTMRKAEPNKPVFDVMECPPPCEDFPHVNHIDLSDVSIQLLWACEAKCLEKLLKLAAEEGVHNIGLEYDQQSLKWMQTGLAKFLGVEVLTGQELADASDTAFEMA